MNGLDTLVKLNPNKFEIYTVPVYYILYLHSIIMLPNAYERVWPVGLISLSCNQVILKEIDQI